MDLLWFVIWLVLMFANVHTFLSTQNNILRAAAVVAVFVSMVNLIVLAVK